jgi:CBS domain containing-hemolysin-like protein
VNLPLILAYLSMALLLLWMLHYQARLTHQLYLMFREAPLVYSQVELPEGINLRGVAENPRLSYFALAISGMVIRILVVVLALQIFGSATMEIPLLVQGVVVVAALLAPELVARGQATPPQALTRGTARVLRVVGRLVRFIPGPHLAASDPAPDPLKDAVLTHLDGQEVFDSTQQQFLGGLLGLRNRTVRQCMVPGERMVTVNGDWSVSRAARELADYSYARVPVRGQGRGDVVGLVHTKDIVLLLHSHQEGAFVKNVMRDIVYIPANMRLDRVLVQFQSRRLHIAAVQDEYGKTCGLITLDDVLREALSRKDAV